jgi:hypothetical protein
MSVWNTNQIFIIDFHKNSNFQCRIIGEVSSQPISNKTFPHLIFLMVSFAISGFSDT